MKFDGKLFKVSILIVILIMLYGTIISYASNIEDEAENIYKKRTRVGIQQREQI